MRDTFIYALQGLGRFRGEAAFSTWLTRIALNVWASHYRAQQVRQSWLDASGNAEVEFEDMGRFSCFGDPEETLYRKERQELVTQSLRALPAPYRETMWLRYMEELSYVVVTNFSDRCF